MEPTNENLEAFAKNAAIVNKLTRDEYNEFRRSLGLDPVEKVPQTLVSRILNPVTRRWAYGVTIAAVGVYAAFTDQPELVPVLLPLALALFYVDKNGESQ